MALRRKTIDQVVTRLRNEKERQKREAIPWQGMNPLDPHTHIKLRQQQSLKGSSDNDTSPWEHEAPTSPLHDALDTSTREGDRPLN